MALIFHSWKILTTIFTFPLIVHNFIFILFSLLCIWNNGKNNNMSSITGLKILLLGAFFFQISFLCYLSLSCRSFSVLISCHGFSTPPHHPASRLPFSLLFVYWFWWNIVSRSFLTKETGEDRLFICGWFILPLLIVGDGEELGHFVEGILKR